MSGSPLDAIPDELLLAICGSCDILDLRAISLVSHRWKRIADELRKGLSCINELEMQR